MAVQQLTQPIVNPISAFDATRAHNITFTVIGGAQVVANRLVISNNETGAIVYNKTAITMKLEHTIPANILTNGGYYNAVVYTIDNANNESVASTAVPFYCYSQPVLTIDNIPATETIENGTYTFTGTYIQQEGEILNSYQYTLYDSNKNVLSKTPLIYYETDSSLSYTFVGMSNDTSYYIELSGETVNGTHITSGVIYFTVRYIQPASFAICDLVNNCDDGYIQVSSNIVAIDGKSNPDPPIYIDDKEVDLRDPDSWVEWDSGFRIQDDFTLRAWGRDFNPYEPIITLKNDIDTPQTPNKIEMKWMTGDVIKNLPLYTSKSGNNINITDSEAANIQNLTVGGNSVEDKDNITQFVVDGNSKQETTMGYNLCPSFDSGTWTLKNGATISNNILTLPNANSSATSDFIEWNYGSLFNIQFFLNSGDNYHLDLSYYTENKESLGGNGRANKSATPNSTIKAFKNFSPTDSVKFKYIRFTFQRSTSYAPNEYSVSNVQISEKDADYEPYTGGIPSPNPDYPQEIEVIGDNINIFNKSALMYSAGATKTELDTGVRLTQTVAGNYKYCWLTIGKSELLGKTLTMQAKISPSAQNVSGLSIFYGNASRGAVVNSGYGLSSNGGNITFPILSTFPSNCDRVNLLLYVNVTGTGNVDDYVDFTDLKIEIGDKATLYSNYNSGSVGLEQSGKNLLNTMSYTTETKNGVTATRQNDGSIKVVGTATADTQFNIVLFTPSAKEKTYFLSGCPKGGSISTYYLNLNVYGKNDVGNGVSFTNTITPTYVRIKVLNGVSIDTVFMPMIVEGTYSETTLPAYEPYHEPKIIPIDLQGNTLAKVGNVKDELTIYKNGEIKINKKVGKIVLDGNETWKLYKTYLYTIIDNCALSPTISTKVATLLSDKFTATSLNDISNNANYGITYNALGDREQQKGVCFNVNDYFNSVATLKTWLSNNNVEVYYPLATPQIITLPSISPIELEQGTNIFTPITNLNTTMTTNYGHISVGDIKNIINVQDFNITYNQAYYQDTNTNFKLQPNYLYTLSFDYNINSESTDLYFSIGYGADSYETNIANSIQYKTQNKGRNTISFIAPEEVSDNDTLWVRFAQTIILANVNVDISNIQLEYGKKATDYQTPGLYNIYLTSAAKNLYNYETPLYIQRNNVSYTEIQGGYEITPVIVDTPASLNIGWKSLLNPGDTYTVSYSQLGQFEDFKLYKTDKNSQKIISEIPLDNNTFVAPDGFYDLQLAFSVDSSSTTNHIDIWNIQIEASNVITTYDPYISNSSIITLEEPLRSSGEYRDLICLVSPNLLNPANQSANVSGSEKYYLSQVGNVSYTLDFINEDNNKISSIVLTSGVFTTPDNCVKVQIGNVEATDLTNNKVQINIGETARVYYPYVTVPSLIRYCKEENGVISVLDTPIAYDLSTDNQSALEVLTTYTPISNVFTNNTVLGQLYLDYVSGYSNQQIENAYVLLKCWNANKMPYVIHSNYIDIPSDYNKVFIWCRRKSNLFDLKIEDLGDYREHDKPIDTDKPVVELVVDKTGVTRTEIPVTATSIDNVGLRTVRFSKDNGATWDEIVPVDGLSSVNSYTFTGLTPDTTYTIRAEAIDLSGNIGGISENVTTLA